MSYQNWDMFGEEIKRTVQDAVDTHDFHSLNQSIMNTVNRVIDPVNRKSESDIPPLLFKNTKWVKIWAILLTAIGGFLSLILLIPFLILILIRFFVHARRLFAAMMILGALVIVGLVLTCFGTVLLRRLKRFQVYIKELGMRGYFEVKKASDRLRKNRKFVVRELSWMIRKKWFLQGHLDRQKTCFISSDDMYGQYCELMERMEEQRLKENAQKEEQERKKKEQEELDPKVRAVIQAGDEYIRKIRECNDKIPGEEISEKISKIENLVNEIFDRVEKNPACISDIRKLMDYYLPTTVKLLDAYAELDSMPTQGENIISSKNEIEKTLDTLNIAFTKLLDGLFREKAWDVSADISVLNTMLAQEGLTKKDF